MKRALLIVCLTACEAPPPYGLDPAFYALCQNDLAIDDELCRAVAGMRLPDELPAAHGNAYADDVRAAELGRQIFYDADFATVAGVSCASCHRSDLAFTDGLPVSEVIPGVPGARNSPPLYNAARLDGFFFWDGRADSLWSQPLFAFENAIEMNVSRVAIAHRVFDVYRSDYEAVFGALPALDDTARFPAAGRPGTAEWDAMAAIDQDAVDRVAANVGKALEAYMRRIVAGPSALDRYIDGDADALDAEQSRGLARFAESGCAECHSGPMLTDGTFRYSSVGGDTDRGRAAGIETLLANEFNSEGPYFDRDAGEALPLPSGPTQDDEFAFRVPSMRNIVQTAPYEHDGSRTLEEILAVPGLLYEEGDEVVIGAFLRALDGAPPTEEWSAPP